MLGGAQNGLIGEAAQIVKEEGPQGLLKGVGPRVGWMALGGYIFFGVYEQCIRLLTTIYHPIDDGGDQSNVLSSNEHAHELAIASEIAAEAKEARKKALTRHESQTQQHVPSSVALLAGGLAGMVIDFALYPIDTLKTRTIQGLATEIKGTHATPAGYQGLSGLFPRLVELRGLWHGIGAAMLPAIPSASVFFVTYEGVKDKLAGDAEEELSFVEHSIAAATAEAACVTIRVPAEFVKLKLQSSQSSSLANAISSAWKQGGLLALYRGFGATLCLDLPFALLQFPLYEDLKARLANRRLAMGDDSTAPAANGAVAGALAGATAAFFTTPLDVMRTRHVLYEGERQSLLSTVMRIHKMDGLRGFWRGVLPRTIYMAMGGTLYSGTYSYCTAVLTKILSRE